jgi:hypothetical protein
MGFIIKNTYKPKVENREHPEAKEVYHEKE